MENKSIPGEKIYVQEANQFIDYRKVVVVEIVVDGVKIHLSVDENGFDMIKKRKLLSLSTNQKEDYEEIQEIKGKSYIDFKKVSLIRIQGVY